MTAHLVKFDTSKDSMPDIIAKVSGVLSFLDGMWELEVRKPKRSLKQNNSMWLFCTQVAAELSGIGNKHKSVAVLSGKIVEHKWDKDLVKRFIWNPVMIAATGKTSSRKLTTNEVDKVAEPIIDLLRDHFGFGLLFPSQLAKQLEEMEKKSKKALH